MLFAKRITVTTLVGVMPGTFPIDSGNCFSIKASDNREYKIVNFIYENLKELIDRKYIEFPIEILKLSNHVAIINDERIPEEWYSKEFCTICCPRPLLPLPQQLAFGRQVARGDIKVLNSSNKKYTIYSQKITPKSYPLKKKWTVHTLQVGLFLYAPWIPEIKNK